MNRGDRQRYSTSSASLMHCTIDAVLFPTVKVGYSSVSSRRSVPRQPRCRRCVRILRSVTHHVVRQDACQHRLPDWHGANADAWIVATLCHDVDFLPEAIDGGTWREDRT